MIIAAGRFKAECLKLMNRVYQTHEEIIISKHGKPVAKLVPIENKPSRPIFGFMRDTIKSENDIVKPSGELWNAEK